MSVDEESYEEHVHQNNTRLVSIATNLREPGQFAAACSELTQWCSDPRAFTTQFEDNLLSALQIAVENGTKDGFDFTLAHQLITCCFQHRKLLSKESAVRINRWYEQYRRIKKNGCKRKRKSDVAPVDPGGGGGGSLEQITVTDSGCTSSMWPQGGPMAGAAQMTSPGYPGAMPGMMPGYPGMPQGAAGGPFPQMDPTGARAAAAAGGYPEGYDHQAMLRHRQMMMAQHMSQQQRRPGMPAQGYPEGMYPIPMGANSVPGQSQPLLRMPAGQAAAGQHGYPPSMMAGRGPGPGGLMSPGYPPGSNHQMIKASPPVLFSNLQQQPQSQPVMSYPNPHVTMPPPYAHEQPSFIMLPAHNHPVVPAFTPPEGVHQYQTTFNVNPEMFGQLSSSAVFELQLKSYSSQDDSGSHRTAWPTRPGTNELAIQVLINGQPIPIFKDRSTLVKRFVVKGDNKLEINSIPLPYKHYYQIQPVHMMHTAKFIEEVFANQTRRGLNSDCFKQRLLSRGNGNTIVVPLNDPKTNKRLLIPARCVRCLHANCFDLRDLLQQQFECSTLVCPIPGCSITFTYQELEVDSFIGDCIRQATANNQNATEVILEQNGCYRLADGQQQQQSRPESVGRKRPSDDGNNAQSLKRIKSEQFPCSSSSPFAHQVNSVPGGMPLGHSPANMMSPFGQNNISPKKEIMSPPVGVGAGTPQPSVKEEPQPLPGASTLTSPHGHPVANNGSVDSVNGSAPYTPASMNGTSSTTQTQQQQVEAQNTSLTLLESDVDPFRPDDSFSPAEMIKYLQDGDLHSGCHRYELNDQTLTDMQEILNREAMRVWGVSLQDIERQLPPLLLPCSNN